MSSIMKVDIQKFDWEISFNLWKVQMRAVLIQHGLWKVLSGPYTKPEMMTDEQWAADQKKRGGLLTDEKWEEMELKTLSAVQLCLAPHVLREVLDKTTAVGLWVRLEELYMTKSLANKIRLKERLYTFRMTEGARLGNFYCDPLATAIGHKITVRQRWTPTALQLEILERIFKQGTGTPSKQTIKEITAELSQHGQISETNVYNWFQNRRARSKKKQQNNAQSNAESEVETDAESPKDKKTKPENFQSPHNLSSGTEDLCFQGQMISSNFHSLDPRSGKMGASFASNSSLEPSQSFDMNQLALYESVLQNTGMDHLIGKMELLESYNAYQPTEDYSMTG